MFTGIIEGTGKLIEKRAMGGGVTFRIESGFDLSDPREGESIAINGVCLTAREIDGRRFLADVSPETLSRTTLGALTMGSPLNMERALRLSDRLGGHIVSGHIDCTAQVLEKRPDGEFTLFSFRLPEKFGRYIIEKGSVAIDGISLTVNSCNGGKFSVSIIPHTFEMTTLGRLEKGGRVNIEVDIIGKYVEKLLSTGADDTRTSTGKTINPGFLAEHGFL
jgi:riboflavin synthase